MNWGRILAHITGTVDQELLLRNEYLAAENRILKIQLQGLKGAKMSSVMSRAYRRDAMRRGCSRR
jgi:hypothetical protein